MNDREIWKSYVWHAEKCWFVSTIKRDYDTAIGALRGMETIVWEYDWNNSKRGVMVHQCEGLNDHQEICRQLIANGVIPDED